jgi:hypothetical protein
MRVKGAGVFPCSWGTFGKLCKEFDLGLEWLGSANPNNGLPAAPGPGLPPITLASLPHGCPAPLRIFRPGN